MGRLKELTVDECIELVTAGVVGRAAICTPTGPHVAPVNYAVHEGSIVFRTAPYSVLGSHAWAGDIAFEVDDFDAANQTGWSVVAVGPGEMLTDIDDLEEIRWAHDPKPWADGARPLYVRLRWRELTGRRIG